MSNLTCSEFGPSLPVMDPFKTAQFAFWIAIAIFMLITTGLVLYVRGYRRRLRVRSLLPYFVGSVGGANYILLRAVFDYVGREYFPCYLNIWVFYLYIPNLVIADILSAALFVSKQFKRQHLNANTLHSIAKLQHEHPDSALVGREKIDEWFKGLWNYGVSMAEVSSFFGHFDEKWWYHSNVNVSSFREATYECCGVFLVSLPFIITPAIRGSIIWQYNLDNGCSGCIVEWTDVLLNFLYFTAIGAITFSVVLRVKKNKLPDPLRYVEDLKYSALMGFPLIFAGYILLIVDPDFLMKQQLIDWHVFEMIVMVILHCMRTVVQLYRTSRSHQMNKQNIKLLDILIDTNGKGALLFEKHLIFFFKFANYFLEQKIMSVELTTTNKLRTPANTRREGHMEPCRMLNSKMERP